MATLRIKQWSPPGAQSTNQKPRGRKSRARSANPNTGEQKIKIKNLTQPPIFDSEETAPTHYPANYTAVAASPPDDPTLQLDMFSMLDMPEQSLTGNFGSIYTAFPNAIESVCRLSGEGKLSGVEGWKTPGVTVMDCKSTASSEQERSPFPPRPSDCDAQGILSLDSRPLQLLGLDSVIPSESPDLGSTDAAQAWHSIMPQTSPSQNLNQPIMLCLPTTDITTTLDSDTNTPYSATETVSTHKVGRLAGIEPLTPESDAYQMLSSIPRSPPHADEPKTNLSAGAHTSPPAHIEPSTPQSRSIPPSLHDNLSRSKVDDLADALADELEERQAGIELLTQPGYYNAGEDGNDSIGRKRRREETDVDQSWESCQPDKRQRQHGESGMPRLAHTTTHATAAATLQLSPSPGDDDKGSHSYEDDSDGGAVSAEEDPHDSDSDHEGRDLSDWVDSARESPVAPHENYRKIKRCPWSELDELMLNAWVKEEMPWPWIAHELKREVSAVTQHWRIMNKRDSKPARRDQVLPSAQQAIPDTKDDQRRTTEFVTQRRSRTSDEPGRKRRLENASLRTPNTGSVEGNEAFCTDEVPHDWEATGILGETIATGKKHYWVAWAPTITDDLEKIKKSVKRWNAVVREIAAGGKKLFWVAWPPTLEPEDNLGNMRELKREWDAKGASGLLLRGPPSCQSPVQGTVEEFVRGNSKTRNQVRHGTSTKRGSRAYTPGEDGHLIKLRDQGLTWKEIHTAHKKAFPHQNRAKDSLAVRYHSITKHGEWNGFGD